MRLPSTFTMRSDLRAPGASQISGHTAPGGAIQSCFIAFSAIQKSATVSQSLPFLASRQSIVARSTRAMLLPLIEYPFHATISGESEGTATMTKKAFDPAGKHLPFKLGKTPARPGAVKFKMMTYLRKLELPTPPKVFGHQGLIGAKWGMLGNDDYGDCVWAGAAHETMLWNKEAAKTASFNNKSVLSDYSAVTGFKPSDPNTDQGTDMQVAASYRRKKGVLDAAGKRHKIGAYLALKPGDIDQLALAIYLFGATGIGIKFPGSAMDQFKAGKPWSVVPGAKIEGGHYIPGLGRDKNGNIVIVTWGKIQLMTPAFYEKYCDEVVAYVSKECLRGDKSLEGFDYSQLFGDLKSLST